MWRSGTSYNSGDVLSSVRQPGPLQNMAMSVSFIQVTVMWYKYRLRKQKIVQTNQQTKKCSSEIQNGKVPSNLKSRLLAPTEREYVPGVRIHD